MIFKILVNWIKIGEKIGLFSLLQNKNNSVLKGKASAIIAAAKKEKIDQQVLSYLLNS